MADGSFQPVRPSEGGYGNVAACVGGGTLSYGAMAWRYTEKDFRMRSTYGAPEGSSLEDWPISYDDLEPFYSKAEWEIGVSGASGANPFEAKRQKAYPMPALPFNTEAVALAGAALGLASIPDPDGDQLRHLSKTLSLHTMSALRGICVRGECEEFDGCHGDSESFGD